ncbi:MAG: hypothetical protein KJO34_06155 [Deltaproteobacteria bacterium]|nr:hypothetical protein [Deltaproteobacteria bacterium]
MKLEDLNAKKKKAAPIPVLPSAECQLSDEKKIKVREDNGPESYSPQVLS